MLDIISSYSYDGFPGSLGHCPSLQTLYCAAKRETEKEKVALERFRRAAAAIMSGLRTSRYLQDGASAGHHRTTC